MPRYNKASPSIARLLVEAERLLDNRQYPSATGLFLRVIEQDPNNVDAYLGIANSLFWFESYDAALAKARQATTIAPEDARTHAIRARICAARGRYSESEREFKRALELKPDSVSLHSSFGAILLERGSLREAKEQLTTALAIDPTRWLDVKYLSQVYTRRGQRYDAIMMAKRAFHLHRSRETFAQLIGAILGMH